MPRSPRREIIRCRRRESGGYVCAYGNVGEILVTHHQDQPQIPARHRFPSGCYVDNIDVDPEHQGRGIGTRLYEAAAKYCWDRRNLPLHSGYIVSSAALTFWEKQFKKGRATRVKTAAHERDPDVDDWYNEYRYTLRTPPPRTLRSYRRR